MIELTDKAIKKYLSILSPYSQEGRKKRKYAKEIWKIYF